MIPLSRKGSTIDEGDRMGLKNFCERTTFGGASSREVGCPEESGKGKGDGDRSLQEEEAWADLTFLLGHLKVCFV